jgi:hypothetical protein
VLRWTEFQYVEALNAVLAAPPNRESDADVNRWRGHAEAYRNAAEEIRRELGVRPGKYTTREWREANGVYTEEQTRSWTKGAS